MARLLLIRHAPTPETGRVLSGRLPGRSLTPEGEDIAGLLATELRSIRLAAIYSSPLERAMETAAPIAAAQKKEVIAHEGLLEVDYGAWSGRSLKSLYRLRLWRVVIRTPSRAGFPGGESIAGAQHRMVSTCEELSARHKEKTIALVTHADPIKAVVSHFLGQPLDLFNRIAIAPASVTVLDLPNGGWPRLLSLNADADSSKWH